ncbi:MAG: Na/Pi cotransporter family protein [Bdellovibrionales bacterium]|nr:Na/Pi cotransporter family protein [Bdellovibrionales bacterium]
MDFPSFNLNSQESPSIVGTIDTWKFLAGLGLFLFGMTRIEESLKELAGRSFRRLLKDYTTNRFVAIVNGIVSTAILQSSSVVTLLVLAFAGAEIITLRNALGIILGANLGSTFTGWIVATVGFEVDLNQFVLPLLGIGCSGLAFLGPRFRFYHLLAFFAGLGLLFMGLDFMRVSVSSFASQTDLSLIPQWGVGIFFLFGALFTSVIQSSAATMMITLSALHSGIVGFENAAALIVGADLGTTATALIGAVGGTPTKKRIATAHFLFNVVTALATLAGLPVLLELLGRFDSLENPLYRLVAFHSSFNLIGILVFIPLLGTFESFLMRLFTKNHAHACHFIHQVNSEVPEAALAAAKRELTQLSQEVFRFNSALLGLAPSTKNTPSPLGILNLILASEDLAGEYDHLKKAEGELITYLTTIQQQKMDPESSTELQQLILALRNAVQSAKAVKDIQHNLKEFEQSISEDVETLQKELRQDYSPLQDGIERLWSIDDEQARFEQLAGLIESNEAANKKVASWVYQRAGQKSTFAETAATFLNVNREIFLSNRYLLQALKDVLLSPKAARDLTSLPRA